MPYLTIVENEAERSRETSELTESTCGVFHPTEQFGRGGHSVLAVRFLLIRGGARFEGLIGANNFLSTTGKVRGVYVVKRNDQRQRQKQPHSRTVGRPTV